MEQQLKALGTSAARLYDSMSFMAATQAHLISRVHELESVPRSRESFPYVGVAAAFRLTHLTTPGVENVVCRASNADSQHFIAKTQAVDIRGLGVDLYVMRLRLGHETGSDLGALTVELVPREQWTDPEGVDWTGALSPEPMCQPYNEWGPGAEAVTSEPPADSGAGAPQVEQLLPSLHLPGQPMSKT
jgi:hypothetical protein